MCAAFVFACYMYAFVGVLSMVYAFMALLLWRLCGGLQDLLELVCKVPLGSRHAGVEGYLAMGKFPA